MRSAAEGAAAAFSRARRGTVRPSASSASRTSRRPTKIVVSASRCQSWRRIRADVEAAADRTGVAWPDRGLYPRRGFLPRRRAAGSTATTSSFAAACGRRWNFSPKRLPRGAERGGTRGLSRVQSGTFRTEDRLTFHQVFLSATRRGALDATQANCSDLSGASAEVDTATMGILPLGEEFRADPAERRRAHVRRRFCPAAFRRGTGTMAGPIASSFGRAFRLHRRTSEGKPAAARAVRPAVQRMAEARRIEAEQSSIARCGTATRSWWRRRPRTAATRAMRRLRSPCRFGRAARRSGAVG